MATEVVTPGMVPSNYQSFAVFDLNHDSRQDIVVAYPDPLTPPPQYSRILLFSGQSDGTFLSSITPSTYGPLGSGPIMGAPNFLPPTVADFDGDGYPDLLGAPSIPALYSHYFWIVIKSSGGADFEYKESDAFPSLQGGPWVRGVLDLNGDGKLDLVVWAQVNPVPTVASYVAISFGNGDGTFMGTAVKVTGTDGATNVSTADVNSDGKVDLVVTLPAGATTFYGDGAGHFSTTAP